MEPATRGSRWEGPGRFKNPSSGVLPTYALGGRMHGWLPGLCHFRGIRPGGRSRKSSKRVRTRQPEVHDGKGTGGLESRARKADVSTTVADGSTANIRDSAI